MENKSKWAAEMMLQTPDDEFIWWHLSMNPAAIHILEQNTDKIDWRFLSCNPAAIHILEQNMDKIDWDYLSLNPAAIHLLKKNLDKVNWRRLSSNPSAIKILEKNRDKIDWDELSRNPAIFVVSFHAIFEGPLVDLKEWVWEYPEEYIKLDLIRRKLMRAFLDTRYKLCRTRMTREFKTF